MSSQPLGGLNLLHRQFSFIYHVNIDRNKFISIYVIVEDTSQATRLLPTAIIHPLANCLQGS